MPVNDDIEMKGAHRDGTPQPPKTEEPPSTGMVVFSVSFYLVAAIVVSWSSLRSA